ncbi:MAG: AraC family transcriptional regulator [Clostridia bacterium]|nr:AraC family transcriptional regulator [Clostridia bacterium]
MNNTIFYKSFYFSTQTRKSPHYNNAKSGNQCHFIAQMKKGNAKLVDKNGTININEGDIFYIPPSHPYQSYWVGDSVTVHYSFGFKYFPTPKDDSYTIQVIKNPPQTAHKIFDEIASLNTVNLHSVSLLYQLLDILLPLMQTTPKSKAEIIVESAEKFMSDNLNFSIPDVAKYCSVSESVLYSVFKKVKGETPVDVKHKILVDKAINILSSTDYTIEYISQELGFSSATYFRKIFTEVTGKRPKDYRTYHGF